MLLSKSAQAVAFGVVVAALVHRVITTFLS